MILSRAATASDNPTIKPFLPPKMLVAPLDGDGGDPVPDGVPGGVDGVVVPLEAVVVTVSLMPWVQ